MTVVIDSSALIGALVRASAEGLWAASVLEGEQIMAPELLLSETANGLRRLELQGHISSLEASSAFDRARTLPVELHPFTPFAQRVWELRFNLTAYDAWYVAMAESMDCPLATLDERMARASGTRCEFLLPHPIT